MLSVAVGIYLAAGVLGVAAADHVGDSKVDSNVSWRSTTMAATSGCSVRGRRRTRLRRERPARRRPRGLDYRGFDDGLAGGYSRFGDSIVVTVGDRQHTITFT